MKWVRNGEYVLESLDCRVKVGNHKSVGVSELERLEG